MGRSRQASDLAWQATRKNSLINGNFDIWQRDTSFAITGAYQAYQADRWQVATNVTAGTLTCSRQAFTLGQTDVPGDPTYFYRMSSSGLTVDANVSTSLGNYPENVRTFAGQTVTVSFYANGSKAGDIGLLMAQHFGTGGSPSGTVLIQPQMVSLAGSGWEKVEAQFTLPSITGKTLGTDPNSSHLRLFIVPTSLGSGASGIGWSPFDYLAGTETLDLSQVQLEVGDQPTDFEVESRGDTLLRCMRYYFKLSPVSAQVMIHGQAFGPTSGGVVHRPYVPFRTAPTVTTNMTSASCLLQQSGGCSNFSSLGTVDSDVDSQFIRINTTGTPFTLNVGDATMLYMGSAEHIEFDAEL